MKVEIFSDINALPDLRNQWDQVRSQCNWPSFFSSPLWIDVWQRHWLDKRRPVFVAAEEGGKLVGIMPLIAGSGTWRRLPVQTLLCCSNDHSLRGGIVMADEHAETAGAEMLRALSRHRGWHMLILDGLDSGAKVHQELSALADRARLGYSLRGEWSHCYLKVQGTFDEYMKERASLKRSLKRSLTALQNLGKVEMRWHRTSAEVLSAIPSFLHIDANSWKSREGEIMTSGNTQRFYSDVFESIARAEKARLLIMSVGGEPICGVFCIHDNGTLYGLKTSFKEKLENGAPLATSKTSPGLHIYEEMTREAFASGAIGLDFVARYPAVERFTETVRTYHSSVIHARAIYPRMLAGVDRGIRKMGIDKKLRALGVAK